MATKFQEVYKKDIAFLEQVIFNYHPRLKNSSDEVRALKLEEAAAGEANTEMAFENLLPLLQPALTQVDIDGMDYTSSIPSLNMSDSKTATASRVTTLKNGTAYYHWTLKVKVLAKGGTIKQGSLLLAVYNEYTNTVDYFHIPNHAFVGPTAHINVPTSSGSITSTYNIDRNEYSHIECYRCSDIFEMLELPRAGKQ